VIQRPLALASIAIALASPAIATAQPASDDVAQADALFKEAKQLTDAGRYADACPKFSESQRLAPGIGIAMHLANCYERTGRTASAWAEFREAEKLAGEREDPRAGLAKKRAEALDRKLSLEQADTAFREAKQLRDAGHHVEACDKFAASQKLAPAVGVTMYLADCYETVGRTASAWIEFREAERLAHEKHDVRAGTAHTRAHALEAKLRRLTIAVSPDAAPDASEVRMDGEPLPREQWNVALAVDPVDHVITLHAPGRAERTLTAHVEADSPAQTVQFDDSSDSGAAPVVAVPLAAVTVAPVPAVAAAAAVAATPAAIPPAGAEPKPSTPRDTRRWIELGLVGGAAAGIGVGAAFLVAKNNSMSNGGPDGSPQVNAGFAAASAIGFGVAGAALVSAIVVYLTTPQAKETALVVAPVPLVGGAGAFLEGRF
jgi:D-alanyl-D-alanine dipeptidase